MYMYLTAYTDYYELYTREGGREGGRELFPPAKSQLYIPKLRAVCGWMVLKWYTKGLQTLVRVHCVQVQSIVVCSVPLHTVQLL